MDTMIDLHPVNHWETPLCSCNASPERRNKSIYLCFCLPCSLGHSLGIHYNGDEATCLDCCLLGFCGSVQCCGTYGLVRKGYHIKGSNLTDFLFPCLGVGLCQMTEEIEERGMRPCDYSNRNKEVESWSLEWSEAFEDPFDVAFGCCCPSCAYARVFSRYTQTPFCYACLFINPCIARYDMRQEYNIDGDWSNDFISLLFAPGPTYVQMKEEFRLRGSPFDEDGGVEHI
jgi:hypothetical protein